MCVLGNERDDDKPCVYVQTDEDIKHTFPMFSL